MTSRRARRRGRRRRHDALAVAHGGRTSPARSRPGRPARRSSASRAGGAGGSRSRRAAAVEPGPGGARPRATSLALYTSRGRTAPPRPRSRSTRSTRYAARARQIGPSVVAVSAMPPGNTVSRPLFRTGTPKPTPSSASSCPASTRTSPRCSRRVGRRRGRRCLPCSRVRAVRDPDRRPRDRERVAAIRTPRGRLTAVRLTATGGPTQADRDRPPAGDLPGDDGGRAQREQHVVVRAHGGDGRPPGVGEREPEQLQRRHVRNANASGKAIGPSAAAGRARRKRRGEHQRRAPARRWAPPARCASAGR